MSTRKTANNLETVKVLDERKRTVAATDDANPSMSIDDVVDDLLDGVGLEEPQGKPKIDFADPNIDFDPYNAVSETKTGYAINLEYLRKDDRLYAYSCPIDYENASDWKPFVVPPYKELNRMVFDLETSGLDGHAENAEVRLSGIKIRGPFKHVKNKKLMAKARKGITMTLDRKDPEGERKMIRLFFELIRILWPEVISAHNGIGSFFTKDGKSGGFDARYLYDRCHVLGIECPIYINDQRPKRVTSGSFYGKAPEFYPTYFFSGGPHSRSGWVNNDGSFPQFIDTIHLAAIRNKVTADFDRFDLKYLAADYCKFRSERRLELTFEEMNLLWDASGGTEDIDFRGEMLSPKQALKYFRMYLRYDLDDALDVLDYFLPDTYYQTIFFPLALQEMAVSSPARKWNDLLSHYYKKYIGREITTPDGKKFIYQKPQSTEKKTFKGGKTGVFQGLFRGFWKFDVESLYPSLNLRYGIYEKNKDPLAVTLKALRTMMRFRLVVKRLAKGDIDSAKAQDAYKMFRDIFDAIIDGATTLTDQEKREHKGCDGSLKVGINGQFGGSSTGFYPYNNPHGGVLTTGYGRIVLTLMEEIITPLGNIANMDTDGIMGSSKLLSDVDEKYLIPAYRLDENGRKVQIPFGVTVLGGEKRVNPEYIWQRLKDEMPEGINIDLEEFESEGAMYSPLKKNYFRTAHSIVPYMDQVAEAGVPMFRKWTEGVNVLDKKAKKLCAVKRKGKYRKRDNERFVRDFPIDYVLTAAYEGKQASHNVFRDYEDLLKDICSTPKEEMSAELLNEITLKKKIPVSDKKMSECNVGSPGEVVYYYWGSYKAKTKAGNRSKVRTRFPIKVILDVETDEFKIDTRHDIPDFALEAGADFSSQPFEKYYIKKQLEKLKSEADEILYSPTALEKVV